MSRAGRPKKSGRREPNGRIARICARERDAQQVEKLVVLRQPHRKGDSDQLCESSLGRFILHNRLDRALYHAGLTYGSLVRFYCYAKASSVGINEGQGGSGAGVSPEKAKKLTEEVAHIERSLRQISPIGFSGVKILCVFEKDVAPGATAETTGALFGLARLLRVLS
jgi:hypothetical protein